MANYNWISDDICTVEDLLTPAECDAWIALAESIGFSDAPINTFGGPVVVKNVRNNTRVMLDDAARARELWARSKEFAPAVMDERAALGLNERFRLYRYEPGQAFRWHIDGAYQRPTGERSRVTFMVYLNDGFEGGETKFETHVVKPRKGMALLFTHYLLHEGAEVKSGRKYVLRSDVMYSAERVTKGGVP